MTSWPTARRAAKPSRAAAGPRPAAARARPPSDAPAPSRRPISACAAIADRVEHERERRSRAGSRSVCGRPGRRPCARPRRWRAVNAAKKASERRPRSRAAPAAAACAPTRARAAGGDARAARRTRRAATWETTFAIAEPSMPSPKPRISVSESATLARFAAARSTAEPVRVSWNARSQPCAAAVTSTNGAPRLRCGTTSAPAAAQSLSLEPAIRRSAGPAASSSAIARRCPAARASQVACTPTSSASGSRPAPYRRAARGRRPVLEERAEAEDLGEQRAGDCEAGQRHAAEVPDDRRVAQHVERLGGQCAQRRQREPDDLAGARHLVRAGA